MGTRFVLALGLGLAMLLPGKAFGVEHFAFGLTSSTGFDVYQDGARILSNRPSSANGSLIFDSTGGGTFQLVPTGDTIDSTPPAAINTLVTTGATETSVSLRWNATGDDGTSGTASSYDIRYASFYITSDNWASATQVTGEPVPLSPGNVQNFTVTGLSGGQTYHFAMRAADEVPNWSGVSNDAFATTPGGGSDTTSPAQVMTLAVSTVTTSSITLQWTAVGDDGTTGTASTYDVRYSSTEITSANFNSAVQTTGEPVPGVPGTLETFTVIGLASNTKYYFAVRVADEVPNWSQVSNSPFGTTTEESGGGEYVLEGWGADTPGGSGGTTYNVTSLADSGPGTLRDAVSAGNRNIRFSVGGTIRLQTTLDVKGAFLTVDGETAPAPGITIAPATSMNGYLLRLTGGNNAHDVILRHLRFLDAKGAGADNVRVDGNGAFNIVFDHCSFRRAADGNLDITNSAHDITVQWCILAVAPENSLTRTSVQKVTYHHNLFYEGQRKNPRVRDHATNIDIVNNLVHEWGTSGYGANFATGGSGNLVKNYFSVGLTADSDMAVDIEGTAGLVYSSGNTIPPGSDATGTTATRFSSPPIQETTAAESRAAVLDDAGAHPRDADDTSYVDSASNAGDDDTDTTPPAAIHDLLSVAVTQTTVRLAWTAPGDDEDSGVASAYDLRYSTSPITTQNFGSAQPATGEPLPGIPDTQQSCTVANLTDGTTYYFAIKTADEALNWSDLSNIEQATTTDADPGDSVPPSRVEDLVVDRTAQTTATLVWTAPGDDGNVGQAASYDMRFSTQSITEANWAAASRAQGEPTPAPAGETEALMIGGLSPDRTYYFAIKSTDEVGNTSDLSNLASGETLPIPEDETPPSPVDDLASADVRFNRALLGWTETGDDGTSGTADRFELRMAESLITEENWDDASVVPDVPDPDGPFTPHALWVRHLVPHHDYYFAMRVIDEVGNESDLSNVLEIETPAAPDTLPPGRIRDLWGGPLAPRKLQLTWTAPGDSLTGAPVVAYEIRVQTSPLNDGLLLASNGKATAQAAVETPLQADGTHRSQTDGRSEWTYRIGSVDGLPPDVFPLLGSPLDPGETEVVEIDGLDPSTQYYCAVRSGDAESNWSEYSNEVPVTTLPDDPPPPPQEDETPPSDITDLDLESAGTDWLRFHWTAPGDNADEGRADHYELRMAADTITNENWSSATLLVTDDPDTAGTIEVITAGGLDPGNLYYFGIRTHDLAGNVSGLSNILRGETETVLDLAPPFPIADLAVIDSTETELMLRWTTPEDSIPPGAQGSLQVAQYELRYAVGSLSADTWQSATSAPVPVPRAPGEDAVWTLPGFEPGTTFAFSIRSRDAAGNWSLLSNIALGTTKPHVDDPPPPPPPDETAPASVTNVQLTVTDSWTAQLAWTASGDDTTFGQAATYEIRRLAGTEEFPPDPTRDGAWNDAVPIQVQNQPQPSGETEAITVTALSPGWFYAFAIRVLDEANNSSPIAWSSIEQTPFVVDELPPLAVEDLAVETLDSTAVRLRWTAPTDPRSGELADAVQGYVLARSESALDEENFESATWDSSWTGAGEPGDAESVIVGGLAPGTTIHFALRSVDPAGNTSPISNGVHVTMPRGEEPPDDPDPPIVDVTSPARVTTFTGYALGPTAMRLNWISVGDDDFEGRAVRTMIRWSRSPIREVLWSGLDSLSAVPIPSFAATVERYDWTGLQPGATYYLALRVVDDAGNLSPLSNVIAVVLPEILDTAPPAVPTGLHAELEAEDQVRLLWSPGADADLVGYHVYRRRVGETQRVALAEGIPEASFVDTATQPGTSYAYSVAARDATGNLSALSGEVEVAIPQSQTALVVTVREQAADPIDTQRGQLILRWRVEPGPDLQGFRVYREAVSEGDVAASAPGPGAVLVTTELLEGAGPHYFTESTLPVPGSYSYWIEAVGFSGATAFLDPIDIVVPEYVDAVLAVYPNPVVDRISVTFVLQEASPVRVGIYTADGRLLYREDLGGLAAGRQEWSWNLNIEDSRDLPAGTYFLIFEAGRHSQRERFVILRGRG